MGSQGKTERVRKNERVLNLLAYLMRSRRVIPYAEIRCNVDGYNDLDTAESAVSRRFERDKRMLRELGVDVQWSGDSIGGIGGYSIARQSAYMGDVNLSDREVRLLSLLAAFSGRKSGPILANLASACQKLLSRSPLGEPPARTLRNHLVHPARTASDRTLSANLQLFALAMEERRLTAFTYYSISRDATSARLVEPYGVKFFRCEWYLVGRCREAGEIRIFRLDRIKGKARFEGEANAYAIAQGYRTGDYVGRSPWQLSRKAPVKVTVSLDELGAWLVEEARPEGMTLAHARGGATTARFDVSNDEGFFKWLVPLGTHARITAPAGAIEGYTAFVRRLMA